MRVRTKLVPSKYVCTVCNAFEDFGEIFSSNVALSFSKTDRAVICVSICFLWTLRVTFIEIRASIRTQYETHTLPFEESIWANHAGIIYKNIPHLFNIYRIRTRNGKSCNSPTLCHTLQMQLKYCTEIQIQIGERIFVGVVDVTPAKEFKIALLPFSGPFLNCSGKYQLILQQLLFS